MQLIVEGPNAGEFVWTVIAPEQRLDIDVREQLETTVESHRERPIQLWIREVDDDADAAARSLGFAPYRDLWQLRCSLPLADSGLTTRGFTDEDLDDYIGVNNRAFHWHPEQGGITRESVLAAMAEPWFDADGFRLHHDNDGSLIGFCWTKVHAETTPPLGEIYVIAIDPAHHGKGLGKPMTLAGLEWLADHGMADGMLYVESDNHPANATYSSLGFARHHTDRAYRLEQ